jgi:DNA polymerase-3 subunit epsilon
VKEAVAALPPGCDGEPSRLAEETEQESAGPTPGWWPMENLAPRISARRWRRGCRARAIALACDLGPTVLRCDGFAVTRLLERLALDWTGDGAGELTLTLAAEGGKRRSSASRVAATRRTGAVAGWLATPLSPGMTGFTGAAVCTAHGMPVRPNPPVRAVPPCASPFRSRAPERPAPPAPCSTISTC